MRLYVAWYGERSAERTNQRNGYCHRQFDIRTRSLDLAIPKAAARFVLPRTGCCNAASAPSEP